MEKLNLNSLKNEVLRLREIEESKPFIISIMGQTGVGKSSLLNALFNLNLKTDPVKPCTKKIEKIPIKGLSGHELFFYDLPGLGESDETDQQYIELYIKKLKESDVVIWAVHSDNRSVTFDLLSLRKLFQKINEEEKSLIFSKFSFVMTKVDIFYPPPWIYTINNKDGFFSPLNETQQLLMAKQEYYQDILIKPFSEYIISKTYNDCSFNINEDGFSFDNYSIYYKGIFTTSIFNYLRNKFPHYQDVFERLSDNYKIIPCSSKIKYNLTQLMNILINKLGNTGVARFKNFYNNDNLLNIDREEVKEMSNIIVFDIINKKVVFDFSEINL